MDTNILIAQNLSSSTKSLDAVAKPTFPYDGPFQIPTNLVSGSTTGTLVLTSDTANPKVNDKFKVSITINTSTLEVKNYKVVITYDKTLVDVVDADTSKTGSQITLVDTFFQNKTNTVDTTTGKITLEGSNTAAISVNRKVAEIEFKAKKAGTLVLNKESSNTVLVNALDTNTSLDYQALSVTIGTTEVATTTESTTTSSTSSSDLPTTAISGSDLSVIATVFTSVLLIILGVSFVSREKKKRFEQI